MDNEEDLIKAINAWRPMNVLSGRSAVADREGGGGSGGRRRGKERGAIALPRPRAEILILLRGDVKIPSL